MPFFNPFATAVACLSLVAGTACAQEPRIHIDLNAVEPQPNACRLVLTVQTPADIAGLVMETVLFDQSDQVMILTLFDFATLPAGKLRVRQFDMPDTECGDVSRVLFNGVDSCDGAGCTAPVRATSTVKEIEVLG